MNELVVPGRLIGIMRPPFSFVHAVHVFGGKSSDAQPVAALFERAFTLGPDEHFELALIAVKGDPIEVPYVEIKETNPTAARFGRIGEGL